MTDPAQTARPADALLAEATRNGLVECRYYGAAVVLGPDGTVRWQVGHPEGAVYGRSSNKPMQATAMLRAGWRPSPDQLALACSSHSGGPEHVAVVRSILRDAGLDDAALGNVATLPLGEREMADVLRAGGRAERITMNCSGKHASMVATCVVNGWPVDGYLDPTHPVQRRVTEVLEELAGETSAVIGVDGCGAPAHAVSLVALARAFGRIATAPAGDPEHAVAEAIRRHPALVGGHGRDVTRLLEAVPGLVAKDGADGVFAAALPDGTAAAVKVVDGAVAPRLPVLLAALAAAGVALPESADPLRRTAIRGGGAPVGELRSVL